MKNKERLVKKLLPYAIWDYTGLQNWLNEQAQAGYALTTWPKKWFFMGIVHFLKDPQAVHYRYALDPIREKIGEIELQDRTASYQEAGWHYVTKIGKLYAVYRCDDPSASDLYSDPQSLAWAMKKQMRWAWIALCLCVLWIALLFRSEWSTLFHWPSELLMELILKAEILIPLYGIMFTLALAVLLQEIGFCRGIRRLRLYLNQGHWPPAGPRRYPAFCHSLLAWLLLGICVLFLVYLGISGKQHTIVLSDPEAWSFPHIMLTEILPDGANLLPYTPQEMLHSDTFNHSFLAPEQYDVAQGGMAFLDDGTKLDSRLYQEYVHATSPTLAQMVYRGRVAAHCHALEEI